MNRVLLSLDENLSRVMTLIRIFTNFRALRDREMNFLRQTDARLTELEFSSEVDWREKIEGLRGLRRSMAAREGQLEQVSEASLHLVQRSELKDAEHVEELLKEFDGLVADIAQRLDKLIEQVSEIKTSSSKLLRILGF